MSIAVLLIWLLGIHMGWWARQGAGHILVAFARRDESVDLVLLKLGQKKDNGTLLAEGVTLRTSAITVMEHGERVDSATGGGSGFLRGSDQLLLWYSVNDENVLQFMEVGAKKPTTLMASRAVDLDAVVLRDSEEILVCETADERVRCSVVTEKGETSSVASGHRWLLSKDGSTLLMNSEQGDRITLLAIDMATKEQTVLLDGAEAVTQYGMSDDGSWIYYTQGSGRHRKLFKVHCDTGISTKVSDDASLVWGFAPASAILLYESKDEGEDKDRLYTSESSAPIAESYRIDAVESTPDGQYRFYVLTDTEDQEVLYVQRAATGFSSPLLTGIGIDVEMLRTDPPRIIAAAEDKDKRQTVYSISPDGRDVVVLLQNVYPCRGDLVSYIPGESLLYITTSGTNGYEGDYLFITPVDSAEGFYLMEGWTRMSMRARSPGGQQLVFQGTEGPGDSSALYSIAIEEGAKPIRLDDAEFFFDVFYADSRTIVYNALVGDSPEDVQNVQVRKVRADGTEDAIVLYDEASLVDLQWSDIYPWDYMLY